MVRRLLAIFITMLLFATPALAAKGEGKGEQNNNSAKSCVHCHRSVTPNIITDWELSEHSKNGASCADYRGSGHTRAEDVDEAAVRTPHVCANCHSEQVARFSKGKHALAWAAFQAMPTTHQLPGMLLEGMKGCGGCHNIGLKSEEDIAALKEAGENYGVASCDVCHTRHTFSRAEAQQPQACRTCHMGFDHPQWEMYSRPVELSEETLTSLHQHRPGGVETEVFAFGRLPLAYSARCFTARAYNLPKDDCQFRCPDYPDGLMLRTREDESFLVLNGIQTQSAKTHNLVRDIDDFIELEVDVLRISPQSANTEQAIRIFYNCLNGTIAAGDAAVELQKYMLFGECDGYWHGQAGMDRTDSLMVETDRQRGCA